MALLGCSSTPLEQPARRDAGAASQPDATPTPTQDAAAPLACEPERGLLLVTDVLADSAEPCRPWVNITFGHAVRVASSGGGSGSVWSRRTEHGTGLLLTASHVYSPCTANEEAPRDSDGNCFEGMTAPRNGVNLARLTEARGVYASRWSPMFALYNSFIPAELIGTPQILPRNEVSLYVVDATTYEPWDSAVTPPTTADALVPLYDPEGVTLTAPTWADPEAGARVLAFGYPADNGQRDLVAGVGRVLYEREVAAAQQYLRERGDEEGSVAYEPEVEFFYRGTGVRGMSGGGVFDEAGRQIGMMVRASQLDGGVNYVRAVRMSHVVSSLQAAFQRLPAEERARVRPYLEKAP